MDEDFRDLWREFVADSTVENYESAARAAYRSGKERITLAIATSVAVEEAEWDRARAARDPVLSTWKNRGLAGLTICRCNLFNPKLPPAPEWPEATVDAVENRIQLRAQQLRNGEFDYSQKRQEARRGERAFLVSNNGWTLYTELFKPDPRDRVYSQVDESLFGQTKIGITLMGDQVGNVVAWYDCCNFCESLDSDHRYRSIGSIHACVFDVCRSPAGYTGDWWLPRAEVIMSGIFSHRSSRAYKQDLWDSAKQLFVDVITSQN